MAQVVDLPIENAADAFDAECVVGSGKFILDDLTRLRRFLVLGAEEAIYRPRNEPAGLSNSLSLQRLLAEGRGTACVSLITEYATEGRGAKVDQLVFALAMCARFGDATTRAQTYASLHKVCGTPTMLFSFLEFSKALRGEQGKGWGRMQRRGIANWYNSQDALRLAHNITKYRQRKGWTHGDVLRLAHAKPKSGAHGVCYKHVTRTIKVRPVDPQPQRKCRKVKLLHNTAESITSVVEPDSVSIAVEKLLAASEVALACRDEQVLAQLIQEHHLVREHCPTELLNSVLVWQTLLSAMPLTALIRNLNKMTAIGLFEQDKAVQLVMQKLGNEEALHRARIHPFNVLLALRTYTSGEGEKGSLKWLPNPAITEALEAAFYKSFKFVVPTGKRLMLCLDVSGSMGCKQMGSVLSSQEACSALVMAFMHTEPNCCVMAFHDKLVPLALTKEMSLSQVLEYTRDMPFGATDCSLPMTLASAMGTPVDAFVVFTDCETNCNTVAPAEALQHYRAVSGIVDAFGSSSNCCYTIHSR